MHRLKSPALAGGDKPLPPAPSRSETREAFFLLTIAVAAGFGFRLRSLGFYNDDYSWLHLLSACAPATLGNIARTFFASSLGGVSARIGGLIYFPALFLLCGVKPLLYQLVALATDLAVAWNFYRFLVEEGLGGAESLLAAALAALYPTHDSTHHWITGAPFVLAGTLWAVRLARSRSTARHTAASAIFLFCSLIYEAASLLAFLPFLLDFARLRCERKSSAAAARVSIARNWILPATLSIIVAYQRILIPVFRHVERHPMSLSPAHVLKVIQAGLECTVLNRLTDAIARASIYAGGHFGMSGWFFFFAGAGLLIALSLRMMKRAEPRPPADLLLIVAASFFLLGYLPYFFDTHYTPSIFDANNRINMVASLGGAAAFAWLILRLRAAEKPAIRALGAALMCACFTGFLIADQASNAQWAEAYTLQQRILDGVEPSLKTLPDSAVVLLYGFPERVGSGVVFESTYDFDGALQLRAPRPGLRGLIGQNRTRFEKDRAVMSWFGETPISYDHLYAYDASSNLFQRIANEKAGNDFLSGYAARQRAAPAAK